MSYKIGGIQQIGVGVTDAEAAFIHYKDHFGFNVKIFDDSATAELMKGYTGGHAHQRRAILSMNQNGGGGLEIWQYTSRDPSPAKAFGPGDLGIVALGLNHPTKNTGWQRDAFGQLFYVERAQQSTGVQTVYIGVKDLEQAQQFYQSILQKAEISPQELEYNDQKFKSLRLHVKEAGKTAFSKILGPFSIVLIESTEGEHYFKDRFWGDKGYIHLCLDIENIEALKKHCSAKGLKFSVDSDGNFDMGDTGGRFAYLEDPDGTLIELVEVMKFPVCKKPRIQIPLSWKILKPLPKILLKLLR